MAVRIGFVGSETLFHAVTPLAPAGSTVEHLSAAAARAAVERGRLTLIVLDCGDDWQATLESYRELHGAAANKPVATLALVPIEEADAIASCFDMGIADCASLPIRPVEVKARIAAIVRRRVAAAERDAEVQAVRRMATIDPVTGLFNRAYIDAKLPLAIEQAHETARLLALLMLDLDALKPFNDLWGHAAGDRVLKLVSEKLQAHMRGSDTVARYGGDEIAIIMPDTDMSVAREVAGRLKDAVAAARISSPNNSLAGVTVSVGVAVLQPGDTAQQLLGRADAALYNAKRAGRNRVAEAA